MIGLHPESTVALVGCSDGITRQSKSVSALCSTLEQMKLHVRILPSLFQTEDDRTQPPDKRAADLIYAFQSPEIDAVFDITGGDAANAVLPYLDFPTLSSCRKPFFGYSDLSVLLNPLRDFADIPVCYFQPRFLAVCDETRELFRRYLFQKEHSLFHWNYTFLQGDTMHGHISGGNIRCTLKLAGTPWQPDFSDRILFLESHSGSLTRMETMLHQYRQMGAFSKCSGILLGNFTELAQEGTLPALYALVKKIVGNPNLPIVVTTELGHQPEARCLPYQDELFLHRRTP